jgi:hypothetical protein
MPESDEPVATHNIVASMDVATAGAVTAAVILQDEEDLHDDDAAVDAAEAESHEATSDEASETTVFEAREMRDEAATTGVFIVESDDEDQSDVTLVDPSED